MMERSISEACCWNHAKDSPSPISQFSDVSTTEEKEENAPQLLTRFVIQRASHSKSVPRAPR